MAVELILKSKAEFDLLDAYAWYDSRRYGLGDEFLQHIEVGLISILRSPRANQIVHENYRRYVVRRFPYSIFYEVENDLITVWAVFHQATNPRKWKRRLR